MAPVQGHQVHHAGVGEAPCLDPGSGAVKVLKWVGIALAVLLALVGTILGIGLALPQGHVATVSAELPADRETVWGLIRDLEGSAAWRPGVSRVVRLEGSADEVYEEFNEFGSIRMKVESEDPPARLVMRIVDNTEFGGSWTYELAPAGAGTRLTITEKGEIFNPAFRFMARFVMGYEATMREYARALKARLS